MTKILLLGGATGTLGLAGLEAVLEAAGDILEVARAASADSLSALSLLGPVDCQDIMLVAVGGEPRRGVVVGGKKRTLADLGVGVAAGSALLLLGRERAATYFTESQYLVLYCRACNGVWLAFRRQSLGVRFVTGGHGMSSFAVESSAAGAQASVTHRRFVALIGHFRIIACRQ